MEETVPQVSNSTDKLKKILEDHFDAEIKLKQRELETIDERIFRCQNLLDKLRVCIVCKYYSFNGSLNVDDYKNHPAVRKLKCEHLEAALKTSQSSSSLKWPEDEQFSSPLSDDISFNTSPYQVKICVGNVSKYLTKRSNNQQQISTTESNSQYNNDLITHKWMIYIRSPNLPKLDNYIKKVVFYLHSSYKPYDVVEARSAPFQLIKRGWGEFPVHVQIHFKDARNKRVDLTHQLKLDWTQTGLQTFGGEVSKDVELVVKPNDFAHKPAQVRSEQDKNLRGDDLKQSRVENLNAKNENEAKLNETEKLKTDNEAPFNNEKKIKLDEPTLPQIQPQPPILLNTQNKLNPTSENQTQHSTSHDLSPSSFITLESDMSNFEPMSASLNACFDELINELKEKKKEPILPLPPPPPPTQQSSLDALLNLRPKTIKPIDPTKNSSIVLLNKPELNLGNKLKPATPITNNNNSQTPRFLNNLTIKPINPTSHSQAPPPPPASLTQQTRTVIYKVEPSDVNHKETPNNKLNSIVLNTKPSSTESILTNNNKKVKLTSSQLTKVKSSLCETQKMDTTTNQTSLNTNNVDNNNKKKYDDVYSVDCFLEKSKLKVINLAEEAERCVKRAAHLCPLVLCGGGREGWKKRPVYCAASMKEYYGWSYAKRKANEWLRALQVRRKLAQMAGNAGRVTWSTKAVLMWLRAHGFTPLEYQHMITAGFKVNNKDAEFKYVDSLSPVTKLISVEDGAENDGLGDEDEVDVDVVGEAGRNEARRKPTIDRCSFTDDNQSSFNVIGNDPEVDYVKEQLKMIDLKVKSVNLVATNEQATEKTIFKCSLVEKLLFAVSKRFAEDLIRNTCADIYFDSSYYSSLKPNEPGKKPVKNLDSIKKSASLSNMNNAPDSTIETLAYQKFPNYLSVIDIYNTIRKHERYDFLSNEYMAMGEAANSGVSFNQPNETQLKKQQQCTNINNSNNNVLINNSNNNKQAQFYVNNKKIKN